jgi:hypothetical protein
MRFRPICSMVKPWASMSASVQPSWDAASNSSTRRREGCACARYGVACLPRTLDVLTGRRCASRAAPVELPPDGLVHAAAHTPGSRGRLAAPGAGAIPAHGDADYRTRSDLLSSVARNLLGPLATQFQAGRLATCYEKLGCLVRSARFRRGRTCPAFPLGHH